MNTLPCVHAKKNNMLGTQLWCEKMGWVKTFDEDQSFLFGMESETIYIQAEKKKKKQRARGKIYTYTCVCPWG